MKRFALAAVLAMGTALAAGSAWAAAPGAVAGSLNGVSKAESSVQDAQYRPDRRKMRRNRDWRKDPRYRRYKGWRRYGARPRDYRTRGCASVGPIWFCP
jgi:hypothetical protein